MSEKKDLGPKEEQVKKKIEELIEKKTNENSALKKLLDGLKKTDSSKK